MLQNFPTMKYVKLALYLSIMAVLIAYFFIGLAMTFLVLGMVSLLIGKQKNQLPIMKYAKVLLYLNIIVLLIGLFLEAGVNLGDILASLMSIDPYAIHYYFVSGTFLALAILIMLPFLYRIFRGGTPQWWHAGMVIGVLMINVVSYIMLVLTSIEEAGHGSLVMLLSLGPLGGYFIFHAINMICLIKILRIAIIAIQCHQKLVEQGAEVSNNVSV